MIWDGTGYWHMLDENGRFMQEFRDCLNLNLKFKNLDKRAINKYRDPQALEGWIE